MIDTMKVVASNTKKLRCAAGLTQEKLAELCGVSSESVSKIERIPKNVTIETLDKLAQGLHLNIMAFFEPNLNNQRIMELMEVQDYAFKVSHMPKHLQNELKNVLQIFINIHKPEIESPSRMQENLRG